MHIRFLQNLNHPKIGPIYDCTANASSCYVKEMYIFMYLLVVINIVPQILLIELIPVNLKRPF